MSLLFWICLGVIFYTFVGYGLILIVLVKIKSVLKKKDNIVASNSNPRSCSFVIAAYNEEACIEQKILNTLSLEYPEQFLTIYVVADGSTDLTVNIVKKYSNVKLLYSPERNGKVHAINRVMTLIDSEIVVFSDANAILNKSALTNICKHYSDPKVGGVAGEKKIHTEALSDASTAGESIYWVYESKLKQLDSDLNTAIGAAGELFSLRRKLYEPIPEDTILDDFIISMKIVQSGFKIAYESEAFAVESGSLSVKEELKRKIRISAGGIQSIVILWNLLNPFRDPILWFQYVSHRVLRWSIVPILLVIMLVVNVYLAYDRPANNLYLQILIAHTLFYLLALVGFFLEKRKINLKIAFIPYYFCVMNYSAIAGLIRFLRKNQSAVWEKSKRKDNNSCSTYVFNK